MPTKLSAFENDSNFIKKDVADLINYKKTSEINAELSNKVDKKEGYSLIADSELERLSTLKNFDGTSLKNDIQHLEDTKQEKGDYATKEELPTALSDLSNNVGFIDKNVDDLINYSKTSEINAALLNKVDKVDGFSLISDVEKERLSNVENYDDSKIKSDILDLSVNKLDIDKTYSIDEINALLDDKVKKEDFYAGLITKVNNAEGKGLSSNDYTDAEKNKLTNIEAGAERNTVRSVNGLTGDVVLELGNNSSTTTTNGSAYPNFCINSGSVNEYGEPNFITYQDDLITAKAPFIYTTSDGTTYEVKSDISLSTLNYSVGRYNLFVAKTSVFELLLLDNEIHYSKVPPTEINANDIWVDISVFPKKAYIYTGITYKYCEYVPIGSIDVGSAWQEPEPIEPIEPEQETTFQIKILNNEGGYVFYNKSNYWYSKKTYESISLKLRVVKNGVITYVDEIFNENRKSITFDVGTKVSIESINSCVTTDGYNLENADVFLTLTSSANELYTYGRDLRKSTILFLCVVPNEEEELPTENSIKSVLRKKKILNPEYGKKGIRKKYICIFEEEEKVRKNSTLNRYVAILSKMFNLLIADNKLKHNPCVFSTKLRENNHKIRYLTKEEQDRLFCVLKQNKYNHIKPIIIFALYTGMRIGEILSLKWEQIDLKDNYINILKSKSGKERKIPIAEKLKEEIEEIEKKSEYVFVNSETQKPYTTIKHSFLSLMNQAKIENFTFHSFRHTVATRLVESGVDLLIVQEIMGHSNIQTTMRYAHPVPERKKQAIGLLNSY